MFYNEKINIKEYFFHCSIVEPFSTEISVSDFNDYNYIKNKLTELNINSINHEIIINCLKKFYKDEGDVFSSQVDFIYFKNNKDTVLKIMNMNSRKNQKEYGRVFSKFHIK